jgi:hypothetical protein
MSATLDNLLTGAIAMASLAAALFFLRFWWQTRDSFFLLFSVAFGLDATTRFVLGLFAISDQTEPLFYIARLITFALIIIAIIQKNRPDQSGR